MTSIRWLGSPTCSAASPTSHRADFPNCCHGIGNIRTCGRPLEPAAISHVFTIRRTAQILGRDEDLLWELSDQLEPEDGQLWVYDIDGAEIPAFTHDGIEALREIIKDQIDRAG